MDKLISMEKLLEVIEEGIKNNPHKEGAIRANHNYEYRHFMKMVLEMPAAFDKEKVIEELKEEGCIVDDEAGNRAVEIIEKGGVEE